MTFGEKLKSIRKRAQMSQEKLAEKLGVSRQAITKWETDMGMPEIENLMAISALFDLSLDELLSGQKDVAEKTDYLFESVTEYDIDGPKRYDLKLGAAKRIVLSGYDGEKIHVRLVSDTLATLQSDLKIGIDDVRNRIDVDINRRNGMTDAAAKEAVSIFVKIPSQYIMGIGLEVNAETVELASLTCDRIELEVKTQNILLEDVVGCVEIDCNLDMKVVCRPLKGEIAINQLKATSRICIPEGTNFAAVTKGIGTSISIDKGGSRLEPVDPKEADNIIELNGLKSELIISALDQGE